MVVAQAPIRTALSISEAAAATGVSTNSCTESSFYSGVTVKF